MNPSSISCSVSSGSEAIWRRYRMAGSAGKLSEGQWQQVASWITTTPDATLAELQEQVQQKLRVRVGLSTVWRGVETLGVTRKKRVSAPRKPMPKREPAFRSSSRSGPALS
jgi:transposase